MSYFNDVYIIIVDSINLSLSYFINPEKRIHFIYLFSSMIIAFYIYKKNKNKSTFWKYIFNKKIWISKSSFVDYFLFFFNGFIKILFLAPYVMLSFSLTFYVSNSLEQNFGFFNINIPNFTIIILYTITLTVINDLVSFLVHYLMHKNKILWEFHKIHHSATRLNPITQYRIHVII